MGLFGFGRKHKKDQVLEGRDEETSTSDSEALKSQDKGVPTRLAKTGTHRTRMPLPSRRKPARPGRSQLMMNGLT
ncbi:hypothetical protein BINDI_0454 [Bifidobacterium [indicum] DSM 20214 = LMG 11587]|uniref:Uncharacterized protein n=1 Tax=Bifidobacterium [indicum] DSM 20214 = LMG 11587 TaxID=1341694 RepID=A0A087VTM4_9BIFI|nr:hypothetical protein [Bifidobacterium indicum]AIC91735.1 hypothetical protein BINDI_0454 [Bifidobacterium indicum LMG 11587 = DSM 20214]